MVQAFLAATGTAWALGVLLLLVGFYKQGLRDAEAAGECVRLWYMLELLVGRVERVPDAALEAPEVEIRESREHVLHG